MWKDRCNILVKTSGNCDIKPASALTDLRLQLAAKVIRNLFNYKNISQKITLEDGSFVESDITTIGPVLNPSTGKKDTTTTVEEYKAYYFDIVKILFSILTIFFLLRLRMQHIKKHNKNSEGNLHPVRMSLKISGLPNIAQKKTEKQLN